LGVSLSWDDTSRIKEAGKGGYLNEGYLRDILTHEKSKVRKVVFNQKKLDAFFEPDMSNEDIEELIVKLLEEWKKKGGIG
jgi:ParB family chromosome partitioning protein